MKTYRQNICLMSFFLCIFVFSFQSISQAENEIADFTGTLVITTPDGDITLLESGESIPKIKDGSMLEIFDGQITVSTGSANNLKLSCLEHTVDLSQGASVTMKCAETEGSVTVNLGPVSLTDPIGTKTPLVVGQTYPISLEELPLAAPTAQGEQQGSSIEGNLEVDSTSIDVIDNLTQPASPA